MKFTINKHYVAQTLRWTVFLFVSVGITLKIVEVSAYETTRIIIHNPEVGQYSNLVNYGYLPF